MIKQQGSLKSIEEILPAMKLGCYSGVCLGGRRKIMERIAATASLLCEICNLGLLSAN